MIKEIEQFIDYRIWVVTDLMKKDKTYQKKNYKLMGNFLKIRVLIKFGIKQVNGIDQLIPKSLFSYHL